MKWAVSKTEFLPITIICSKAEIFETLEIYKTHNIYLTKTKKSPFLQEKFATGFFN